MMHSYTSISMLVWVAVLCSTRVVWAMDMNEPDNSELADKLNALVRHPGWRCMGNVKILKSHDYRRQMADPVAEILEALSSNRNPVDESNVLVRYKEIWTLLMCKYAEIVLVCKTHINRLIRACRNERKSRSAASFQRYYDCFRSLLTKLYIMSPAFNYMTDALEFLYSLGWHPRGKHGVMVATDKLSEYTLTIRQRTLTKLCQRGVDVEAIDFEIQSIIEYINLLLRNNLHWYTNHNCVIPAHREWTAQGSNEDFEDKKRNGLIPQETTLVQYVENEIDCYAGGILSGWFKDLGFAYNVSGKVTIDNSY